MILPSWLLDNRGWISGTHLTVGSAKRVGEMKRILYIVFLMVFLSAFLQAAGAKAAVTNAVSPGGQGEVSVEEEPLEGGEYEAAEGIPDPLEPWNRLMFSFNDRFYFWLLKPVSQGYSFIVPEQARIGVRNAFLNITTPVRLVNSVLQFKMKGAGNELIRFAVNSVLGIGGLFDVAEKNLGIKRSDEDLGQTLGYYQMGNLFYIVWPIIGPSSARDTVGLVGDYFLDPVNYIEDWKVQWGLHAYDYVNKASLRIGEYEDMKEAALDPYVSLRDAYFQYRRNKIKTEPPIPPAPPPYP
jgi:phospholipid-binding lipoprotein MlaA